MEPAAASFCAWSAHPHMSLRTAESACMPDQACTLMRVQHSQLPHADMARAKGPRKPPNILKVWPVACTAPRQASYQTSCPGAVVRALTGASLSHSRPEAWLAQAMLTCSMTPTCPCLAAFHPLALSQTAPHPALCLLYPTAAQLQSVLPRLEKRPLLRVTPVPRLRGPGAAAAVLGRGPVCAASKLGCFTGSGHCCA